MINLGMPLSKVVVEDFKILEDSIVHLSPIFLRISLVTLVGVLQEEPLTGEMI